MSNNGGQNIAKHGCSHGGLHVKNSLLKPGLKSLLKPNNFSRISVSTAGSKVETFSISQNGEHVGVSEQSDLQCFIDNHSEDLAETFGTTDIPSNNTEWIMTTVDDLGNITFSAPCNDQDPLVSGTDVETSAAPDIGDIFDSDNPSVSTMQLPMPIFTESIMPRFKLESNTSVKSSPCSPSHSFMDSEGLVISSRKQRSFSDSEEKLTAQDRACLEEIERGSQLTQEDKELLEDLDSKKRLQLEIQEFVESADKVSQLITSEHNNDVNLSTVDNTDAQVIAAAIASDSGHSENLSHELHPNVAPTNHEMSRIITIKTEKQSDDTKIVLESGLNKFKRIFKVNADDEQLLSLQPILLLNEDGSPQEVFIQGGSTSRPIPEQKLHKCDLCNQTFDKPYKLKVHVMTHTGDKPFKCPEPGCDWAFTTYYKLKRHQECHLNKKDYVCMVDGCGRKFTTVYNLQTHAKLHEKPLTEACPMEGCEQKFRTKKLLDLHMKTHGEAAKTHPCPHPGCTRVFYSDLSMGSHMKTHKRPGPIVCNFEGCGKIFDKMSRLKTHERIHTGDRPYACDHPGCTWAFSSASKLRRHRNGHTGEKRYKCTWEGCNKAFNRPEHLKGHCVVHTKVKAFVCTVEGCNASFTAKSSWYVHVKKHEQRKDSIVYYCPIDGCERKYKDKLGLRAHIDRHYNKQEDSQKASTLALLELNGVIPSAAQIELQESLASIEAPPQQVLVSPPPPTSPAPPAASTTQIITEEAGAQFIVLPTEDGPQYVTYENLIASGVDLSVLGIEIPKSATTEVVQEVTHNMQDVSMDIAPPIEEPQKPTEISLLKKPAVSLLHNSKSIPLAKPAEEEITDLQTKHNSSSVRSSGGSARTDFQCNQVLANRAKRRGQILKQKAAQANLDLVNLNDIGNNKAASESTDASDTGHSMMEEMMTSHALTIRDPETGAIYVQTQLLQDDPPEFPEGMDEDLPSNTSDETSLLDSGLFHDPSSDNNFTGSTINLMDLEG